MKKDETLLQFYIWKKQKRWRNNFFFKFYKIENIHAANEEEYFDTIED